jgi:hypothetical protein
MARTMQEGFGSIKVKVVGKAFWEKVFSDSDALRVGWYRIAKVNDIWAVMEDGEAYPEGTTYATQQDAVSYCVQEGTRNLKRLVVRNRDKTDQLEKKIQIQQDMINRLQKTATAMDKIAVEVTAPNPMYTHIILGSMGLYENSSEGDRYEYFTRAGGYMPSGEWAEFSGHYNMPVKEALKDLSERIARGF